MNAFLLTLVLCAAPSADNSVLVLPLSARGEVKPDLASVVTESVVSELKKSPSFGRVVSYEDIQATLEVERQKALLGCDDTSCAAEVAAAMGTRFVVMGTLARVNALHVFTLRLLDAGSAVVLASVTRNIQGDAAAVLLSVGPVVKELVRGAFAAAPALKPPPEATSGRDWALASLGGGALINVAMLMALTTIPVMLADFPLRAAVGEAAGLLALVWLSLVLGSAVVGGAGVAVMGLGLARQLLTRKARPAAFEWVMLVGLGAESVFAALGTAAFGCLGATLVSAAVIVPDDSSVVMAAVGFGLCGTSLCGLTVCTPALAITSWHGLAGVISAMGERNRVDEVE